MEWKQGQDKIVVAGYKAMLERFVQKDLTKKERISKYTFRLISSGDKPVKIQLGRTVKTIAVEANHTVVKTVENGADVIADYVIVTVPLGVLKNGSIEFQPELQKTKRDALERMGPKLKLKF